MSTAEMRKTLLNWIESEKDDDVILSFFNKMKSSKSGEYATIEEYNKDLDVAMDEYRAGKFISHDEMGNEIASW